MQQLETELSALLEAISVFSRRDPSDLADLEWLIEVYNRAMYLFAYIEGNARYVDARKLLAFKAALIDDVELRRRVAQRVRQQMAKTGSLPVRWSSAIEWLLQPSDQIEAEVRSRDAMADVEDVLAQIDRDRSALIARLRLGDNDGRSLESLRFALRDVNSAATRNKLLLAWFKAGEAHTEPLAHAMDRLIERRWEHSISLGFRSVAEHGFSSCHVSVETIRDFLKAYIQHALEERRVFLSRFDGVAALDDNMRALSLQVGGGPNDPAAAVDLPSLLEFIADSVRLALNITLNVQRDGGYRAHGFQVSRGTRTLGTIALDRVVTGTSARLLSVDDDPPFPRLPRARVLCQIDRHNRLQEGVSFHAAHQTLHAMGHALVHLAARPKAWSISRFDALPLERLEGLSHWFETLMDDRRFEDRVAPSAEQRTNLKSYRQARDDRARNTRLEQAVVAKIDLDIHQQRGCRIRDVYESQIAAMGGPVGVSFERVVRFMTAPFFRDYPGLGFVYPWGRAFGASYSARVISKRSPITSLAAYFDPRVRISNPTAGAEFFLHSAPKMRAPRHARSACE